MRNLSWFLAGLLILPVPRGATAQTAPPKLNLVIVEGDGAINNVRQRTAREPVVQMEDDNHRPIAGVVILFEVPSRGAGGEFPGGAHSLSVVTDSQGRAAAHGFVPNHTAGQYQIHVTASYNGSKTERDISQTNVVAAATTGAATGASHGKVIAIVAAVAAAAAAGVYFGTHQSKGGSTANTGATISAGAGTVGVPR